MTDISKRKLVIDNYDGKNGTKQTLFLDGDVYMVKSQTRNSNRFLNLNGSTITSYNNSIYSEYVASQIINFINLDNTVSHQTSIGELNGKNYVLCKNFCYDGNKLKYKIVSISNLISNSLEEDYIHHLNLKNLDGVLEFINLQPFIDKQVLTKRFWDQFILDAFNLNRDRHGGNWALLLDENQNYHLAPIFDNGSSLQSKMDYNEMLNIVNNPNHQGYYKDRVINTRHYLTQHADDKKSIMYSRFLETTSNQDCLKSLIEFKNKLDMNKLKDFIDTLELKPEYKKFYTKLYQNSYQHIIQNAFDKNPHLKKLLKCKDDYDLDM